MQASHEKLEEAHKTSVTEFSELEQKQSKLITLNGNDSSIK